MVQQHFSKAGSGEIPNKGDLSTAKVMGIEIGDGGMEALIKHIGTAVIEHGTFNGVNALADAGGAKVTVATPGGGLAAKGTEGVKYQYRGGEMFGLDMKN